MYLLKDKIALNLQGDSKALLKDYTTILAGKSSGAFLDKYGKNVCRFEIGMINSEDSWVVIDKKFLPRLLEHLSKYLPLYRTQIIESSQRVYFDTESVATEDMGHLIPQKTGQLLVTDKDIPQTVSEVEFTLFRLKNNIPVQGVDYDEEMILNLGDDALVDFNKGCYLGQEIVARVHYKGKAPKKLVVVTQSLSENAEHLTSQVIDAKNGTVTGFKFVENR